METRFRDSRMQRRCESEKELRRAYGAACAKRILARIADLGAASSLADFRGLPGRCHALRAERQGQFALEVSGSRRLVLEPVPPLRGEDTPWSEIDAVEVVELVDYHSG
jgi:toxin HigB-1